MVVREIQLIQKMVIGILIIGLAQVILAIGLRLIILQ